MNIKEKLYSGLENEFEVARILLWLHTMATLFLVIAENFHKGEMFTLTFIVEIVLFVALYNSLFKSQKKLYYSFWGLLLLVLIFLVKGVIYYTFIDENIVLLWLYFMSLVLLIQI